MIELKHPPSPTKPPPPEALQMRIMGKDSFRACFFYAVLTPILKSMGLIPGATGDMPPRQLLSVAMRGAGTE